MDEVFKALADETRRQLLDRLFMSNGQSLGMLCRQLDMSRQAVTKHLLILEEADLVTVRRQGREKLHDLNPVPLAQVSRQWLSKFIQRQFNELATVPSSQQDKDND